MKRGLLEITRELVDELAEGWERVALVRNDVYGDMVTWARSDATKVLTNDPEPFPEPIRQAVRARVVAVLTGECPRCGEIAEERDPGDLTPGELNVAQVSDKVTTIDVAVIGEKGAVLQIAHGAPTTQVVLLHDVECEAAPVNLDLLGRSRWN